MIRQAPLGFPAAGAVTPMEQFSIAMQQHKQQMPNGFPQLLNWRYPANAGLQTMQHASPASLMGVQQLPFSFMQMPYQSQGQRPNLGLFGMPQMPLNPASGFPNILNSFQASVQGQAQKVPMPATAIQTPATEPSSLPSRKRSMSTDEETESASSGAASPKPARTVKREKLETGEENTEMGLGGESRLKINFLNMGQPGRHPQVFGKSRLGVPDGLSGTYVLYSERWRSEIIHEEGGYKAEDGTQHVLITWRITNLTTGVAQSRTETLREAVLRHKDGRTLCNKVFRKALEHRAQELEEDVKKETNPIRVKAMKNLIKKLRPKHFSEGPLVFGLRHECVQNRFKSMTTLDSNGFLVTKETHDSALPGATA